MTIYHDELFDIVASDDPEHVLALMPADVSASDLRNRDGTTLVLQCLYSGAHKVLEQLTALFPDRSFHEAAALGLNDQVIKFVERDRACVNLLSTDGWSGLHLAAFFGHGDTVQMLLDHGADPHIFSRAFEINIPLQAACAARATDAALLLIVATMSVDEAGPSGTTALMSAANNGTAPVVDALLAKGADPTRRNAAGKSATDFAEESGHQKVLEKLTAG